MPAWSNISCAQWIGRLREPNVPFSVIGVRPAARISGTRSRDEVGEIVDRVGGADIDMHHHRLRPAVHQVGAVRHGDREILVRHQHRLRHLGVGLLGAAEGFDDRREVGAGIGEEIIDAVVGERAQERLGGDCRPLSGRCRRHALRPWVVRGRYRPFGPFGPKRRLFLLGQSLIRRGGR